MVVLSVFRKRAEELSGGIVRDASKLSYDAIYPHVSKVNSDASGLRSAGFPLSLSGGNWDIFVRTGGVRDSLGIDEIKKLSGAGHFTHVGFEGTGDHPTGVGMGDLLNWLFDGTSKFQARPVIENTYREELHAQLTDLLSSWGLRKT